MAEERKITNATYQGMYSVFQFGTRYHLDGEAFTEQMVENIEEETNLGKSTWLGDWWIHPDANPEFTWAEMVDLALHILHTEATRLFVSNLYLKTIPPYQTQEGCTLSIRGVSGAKRVNAYRGEYDEYSFLEQKFVGSRDTGDKFRLSGKDESCIVEGTWFDWCCFACNILASDNTKMLCPELYEPALVNNNY